MDIKKEKINIILIATSIILLFTYIFSFTNFSSTDKRKLIKSALVNKKYETSINKFEFSQNDQALVLEKKENIWYVSNNDNILLPVDKEIINNFIKNLTKVIIMYEITDKISKNNAFGLTDSNTFCLKYYFSDSEFYQLYFGNLDFSNYFRYLMSGKNTNVYQIENSLDTFLTTSIQFWSEPYIVSRQIINISKDSVQTIKVKTQNKTTAFSASQNDFSKKCFDFLELRHGGGATQNDISNTTLENKQLELIIENGDKSSLQINCFELEDTIILETIYNLNNEKTKTIYTKVSKWTYNKIKEIFNLFHSSKSLISETFPL